MVRETEKVGVIVERRDLDSPWADHSWVPVAALAGTPAATPWTVLEQTTRLTRYYAGTSEIEFFGTDTTMYRENLRSQRPSLWIALRLTDAAPGILVHLVTADPAEAEALTETNTDIIEAVAMPIEIQERLAAFVEAHHVERAFVKRKRDRTDPEAMASRIHGGSRSRTTRNE
ncbi:DUF3305 domain-containing protein [Sinorhizobium medicae]|uniref:Molybdopterin-guanine dinucleotide biosynthesis protein A n=1 Tax=Sinorhizobium medicae (strain WSM419) TaxID=366394 RepID=A6UKR9_SINMW|nr:DUF3305 domain-containing protein [Sinorhizobium medicae]ABR64249.1 molybdopterin-guanine dinucleotide biosynthesis protein A [Sinorhizobium medicae WSM419]MDX0430805.1 DUF3305 domain-containing protein [Sinorhizobium medicae]MDX0444623.1 DUF3305 domain-containing protein [Sinorhizobium medicae]MDX0494397.1 DUF3305 domain-containing protein [Sinorhizobium medicae]MDX0524885.1 DUF3305 domain-containing protein [Sinorhizobium medicae]